MFSAKIAPISLLLFGLSAPAFALEVKSAAAAGSVCKASDGIAVTANEQALSIDLPDLKMQAPGKRLARANCSVSVNIKDSGARQFRPIKAILHHDTLGAPADELTFMLSTWFQGQQETPSAQVQLSPGTNLKTEVALKNAPWSPCVKDVTLNLSLAAVAKSKGGFGATAGITFKDRIAIEWEWQPCKP